MNEYPPCPSCNSDLTYDDGSVLVCPECAHEWTPDADASTEEEDGLVVKDAHGTPLADGDDVIVLEDLEVKARRSR